MSFETLIDPGLQLIASTQSLRPALDLPMQAVTFLGGLEFYLVFLPALYWAVNPALAMRTFAVLVIGDFFCSSLKIYWHGPRPYWLEPGWALAHEGSYGVPSGHASGSLLTWGYLASQLRHRGFTAFAVVLVLVIGFSRSYLAVHFPHDVLIGWLLGATVLALALVVQRRLSRWFAERSVREVCIAATLLSALMAGLGSLVPMWVAAETDPASWSRYAAQARVPSSAWASAGAVWGLMVGYARLQRCQPWQPDRVLSRRGMHVLFGLIGLFAIYASLGHLFRAAAEPASWAGLGLRGVRFACVTWWVTEGAPRLFMSWRWGGGPVNAA